MFVAVTVPLVAIAVGTLLALAGGARPRVLVPVRSFALAAVLGGVLVHLLPEAIAEVGPWALAVFAAGAVAPQLVGRLGDRATRHARLATELGFIGVLLHQLGDGLVLGAVRGHWDVVVAIGAHTVPLAAAVAIGILAIHGRRGVVVRAAALALATIIGIAMAAGGSAATDGVAPWVNAAVAGLLVHLLSHDLPTPPRTGTAPLVEVLAVAAGVALPILGDHGHAAAAPVLAALGGLARAVAVPLAVGLVLTVLAARLPAGRAGLLGAVTAGLCSCRVAGEARHRYPDAAPAALVAFLFAAPELCADTILVGAQLLGPAAALLRLGAAIAMALAAAAVVRAIAEPGAPLPSRAATPKTLLGTIDEVIIHSGPWIAIGLVAAALVAAAVPRGALAGSPALSIALAMIVALPAYVCAAATTPLAAVLIDRGLAPGAAIAALLVGAVANRAVIGAIARAHGARTAAAAIATAAVVAAAAGIAIEAGAIGAVGPGATGALAAPTAGPLVWIAGGLLGLAALRGLWRYGLAAWLEPLHDTEHHHHQHPAGEVCGDGCHEEH